MRGLFLSAEQSADLGNSRHTLHGVVPRLPYRVLRGVGEHLLEPLRIGILHVSQKSGHKRSQRRHLGARKIVVAHGLAFRGCARRREGSGSSPAPHLHSIGSLAGSCKLATLNHGVAPMRAPHQLGGVTCGNEPVALRAVPGVGPGTRKPGIISRERASTGGVTASAAVPTTQTGSSSARDGDLRLGRQDAALASVKTPVTVGGDESGTASCWVWHGAAEGAPRPGGECGSVPRPAPVSAVIGRLRAHGGRFLRDRLAGALGLRPLSGALALLVAVPLAACEADPIGARATLQEWGYTGIGVTAAPVFGRPCRWGEPFAVRFTAHDERGAPAAGWLCATDEAAEDARILLDREGA